VNLENHTAQKGWTSTVSGKRNTGHCRELFQKVEGQPCSTNHRQSLGLLSIFSA